LRELLTCPQLTGGALTGVQASAFFPLFVRWDAQVRQSSLKSLSKRLALMTAQRDLVVLLWCKTCPGRLSESWLLP